MREMNNQNISIVGRDVHMNSSESERCCNPLCQLYDPMSAVSFMRECISEPMNPDPFLIIRNNFPFTLSLFLFLVIINFENTKIFPSLHFTNQNTITISFSVYHCIAYYFILHIPTAQYFLVFKPEPQISVDCFSHHIAKLLRTSDALPWR
jgi:hypothetical protein